MSKPLVHSSSQVHTMIREYTNQEVARILEEEEGSQVKLVPAVILNGRDVRLEFKVGREKMYAVRDLAAFSDAVAVGAYVEYGKELAFHHQGSLLSGMQGTFVFSHGTDRGTEIPEGYILKPYEPGTFFLRFYSRKNWRCSFREDPFPA